MFHSNRDAKMHCSELRASDRQTDRQTDGSQYCVMSFYYGSGHNKTMMIMK